MYMYAPHQSALFFFQLYNSSDSFLTQIVHTYIARLERHSSVQ